MTLVEALKRLRLSHLRDVDGPDGYKFFGSGLDAEGNTCPRCHGMGWVRYSGVRVSCPSCSTWPTVLEDADEN